MGRWVDVWMYGWVGELGGCVDEWMGGGWVSGCVDGWVGWWVDRWMMDR